MLALQGCDKLKPVKTLTFQGVFVHALAFGKFLILLHSSFTLSHWALCCEGPVIQSNVAGTKPKNSQVPMLNLTDCIVSVCIVLLVTTSTLYLNKIDTWFRSKEWEAKIGHWTAWPDGNLVMNMEFPDEFGVSEVGSLLQVQGIWKLRFPTSFPSFHVYWNGDASLLFYGIRAI